jgi:hypothetical protein
MALFVTYIRALGKGMGVPGLFGGPMAKSQRMFLLIVACVYLGIAPGAWQPVVEVALPGSAVRRVGILAGVLAVIVLGGAVTAVRRIRAIGRGLKERG